MEPRNDQRRALIGNEPATIYSSESNDRISVVVVAETADVYAKRQTTGEVILLGNVGLPDPERGLQGAGDRSPAYDTADLYIGDYAQGPGLGKPLSWFVERLSLCQQEPL